ncbi:SDR family oxidoreductase [Clostridium sp. YIM B02569]|uniref:SDR family oxidoreductase n=1 Tax=Clostridium sp. YIM B02569 TaxID=2911967 RepID=UPI001EEEE59A|nr:SDR family oxidoreductase [Clostridium sp. YIM B02569]
MKPICVITGGGSGMGLATAKIIGKDHSIILVGRTVKKLEGALKELKDMGFEAEAFPCDVSDRESVKKLAGYAAKLGSIKAVIHAAGMSPNMGNGEVIFNVNAMGTIYVNEEFSKVMDKGSCIIDVSSMSAYMAPEDKLPRGEYKTSLLDPEAFKTKVLGIVSSMPVEMRSGFSYIISKNFVIWYAAQSACLYGKKGIRVLSVSPGTFATPMGEIEGKEAALFAERGALGRVGDVEEIAQLMALIASDAASYLTGTDILCDGGAIAAMKIGN